MNMSIVTNKGTRKDGTTLFIHTWTGPDKPVYASVVRNGVWKESQAYYYVEDAMEAVNKAWPDVKWENISTVDFVRFVINEDGLHQDDYVASIVAGYFREYYDVDDEDEHLDFQMGEESYSVDFGFTYVGPRVADAYGIPEKYGYWQFYNEDGKELVELRWEY